MKVVLPNTTDSAGRSLAQLHRRQNAPIPLSRPSDPDKVKGRYEKMKLRTNPTSNTSPTYELDIVYFGTGSPEEWLQFRKNLEKVIVGQNLAAGPAKFALARRVLIGDALATFEASAIGRNETNDSFTACMNELTAHIFPARALQLQKRFMRRYLRKPKDTSIRKHVARAVELNGYLPFFPEPRAGVAPTKLDDDELLDILEFGCPNAWQKQMLLQNFDPMEHSIQEFVQFCERVELTEEPLQEPTEKKNKKKRRAESGNGKKRCMLHGEDCGHTTDECRTMKAQTKRMKATYESQHPEKKKAYKQKQEIHALVMEAVEKAFKAGNKKTEKNDSDEDTTTEEENYNFDRLTNPPKDKNPFEDTDTEDEDSE